MTRFVSFLAAFTFFFFVNKEVAAQRTETSRIITVRDGLPQSYVSGICQDNNGFLWVSTLNGLCRYDGRGFKYYWHTSADTAGLSGNVILRMLDVGAKQLLLCYADGKLDLLNTETEKITHRGGTPAFDRFKAEIGFVRSLITDGTGRCWMVSRDGGLIKIDLGHNTLVHLSLSALQLQEPVLGIAIRKDQLLLLTASQLSIRNKEAQALSAVPYPFGKLALFTLPSDNVYSLAMRAGGDLLITDAQHMLIWNPAANTFKKIALPRGHGPGTLVSVFDGDGNYFFDNKGSVYALRNDNSLVNFLPAATAVKGDITVMHIDRSGVMWMGTNGFGLRQYNSQKTGLPGYENKHSFVIDALGHYGLKPADAANTFLNSSTDFANRTATGKEEVWIADRYHFTTQPELLLLSNQKLSVHRFYPDNKPAKKEIYGLQFIAYDKTGSLWGIDQRLHLLKFNTQDFSFHAYAALPLEATEDINGMIAEGEDAFYISSTRNLIRIDLSTGTITNLTAKLPSKDLLSIAPDPGNNQFIWIGTLSDGLIKYNKATGKAQVFSVDTGLPNNTVYSLLPDANGQFWCSSNRGIFLFLPKTGDVRSFTSRDGLLDDEFNRFYSLMLPDGNLAFGGPLGYTVFNPATVARDEFEPTVNLTSLSISNLSGFAQPVASIKSLSLHHNQNFITAEFAAMQFDAPDKIQYRYQLEGFDKGWILTGNQPKATYTGLPPGGYTLLLNGSNTSGKWSRHLLRIPITISPPFWKTWWAFLLCVVTACLLVFSFVHARISRIKAIHAQRLRFERQAVDLHAVSLRAQMNPHFIFNCLNSIKALIQEAQNKNAVHYLTTFVSLIRKQLNNTKNEIPLTDEIQTCKLYLELEAMRFDGRINYKFEVTSENLQGVSIPPLTLQPLIENAIIHGLLPKEDGGTVSIRVHRKDGIVVCEIEDDGIGRMAAARLREKSSRLHESKGVQLLEERIRLHDRLNGRITSFQTIDLVNPDGEGTGTLIILKLNTDV